MRTISLSLLSALGEFDVPFTAHQSKKALLRLKTSNKRAKKIVCAQKRNTKMWEKKEHKNKKIQLFSEYHHCVGSENSKHPSQRMNQDSRSREGF